MKRRYFSALNITAPIAAPSTRSEPKAIPLPDALPEDDMYFPSSCPIPVPEDNERNDFISTNSFVPPHLFNKTNDSFSLYEYDQKKRRCKNAF